MGKSSQLFDFIRTLSGEYLPILFSPKKFQSQIGHENLVFETCILNAK